MRIYHLHTNFKLPPENGYVAVLRPDGSVASEVAYPRQSKNVSFGTGKEYGRKTALSPKFG